jgi:hypothetical protein
VRANHSAGLLVVPLAEPQRHLPGEARREPYQALGMLGEDFAVDPGPPVVPLEIPDRRELDEVVVAGPIPGQQDEVRVDPGGSLGALPSLARPEGHVRLAPQDRANPGPARGFVEGVGGVKIAVVGDGQAVHPQRPDPGHQIRDAVGAVEERVFRVGVEVYERHGRGSLSSLGRVVKTTRYPVC